MKTPQEIFNSLKDRESLQFSRNGEAMVLEAMEEYANQFKDPKEEFKGAPDDEINKIISEQIDDFKNKLWKDLAKLNF